MNIENITPIERSGTEPKNPKLSVHEFIYREPKSDELKALSTTKNPVDTNFRILCTTKDYSEVKDSKKLWETNFVITPIPEGIDPNSEDISAHSFSGRTVRWKEGNSHTELNEKSIRKLPGIPLVGNGFTIGSDGISKGTTFWLAEDSLTEFASKLINSGMQKIETPVMKNEGEVIGPREHAKRTFLQGTIDINTESDIRSSAKEYLGALVNNDLRLLITGEIDFRAKIIELSKKILNEPISRLKIAKTFGSEK